MIRIGLSVALCGLLVVSAARAQDAKKPPEKKAETETPSLPEMLKMTPEEFIKRFDKNGDGLLERSELPVPFGKVAANMGKAEDAKLNRQEVAAMLDRLRAVFPAQPQPMILEKVVDDLLRQFDANKDGKISKEEAKGKVLELFDQSDLNKDGFLDRKELLLVAGRLQRVGGMKGPPPGFGRGGFTPGLDFDDLDKNADGRLSREELKGTRFGDRFDEIDADRSGLIDRREFEAFLRRDREKAAPAEKKK